MMMANTDRHKELIRRWIAFANTGFAGSFDRFIAAGYIGHTGAAKMDRAELERAERQFCEAFPDAHHTIDDLIAEVIGWSFGRRLERRIKASSKGFPRRIAPSSSRGWWCTESPETRSRNRGARSIFSG